MKMRVKDKVSLHLIFENAARLKKKYLKFVIKKLIKFEKGKKMPIIDLTAEAYERSKNPEPGWSHATLTAIDDTKDSKDQSKGPNKVIRFDFTINQGPKDSQVNAGIVKSFWTGTRALGMEGTPANAEAMAKMKAMIASLHNVPINELPKDKFNTDLLLNKSCWIKISWETNKSTNQPILSIVDFSADDAVPF